MSDNQAAIFCPFHEGLGIAVINSCASVNATTYGTCEAATRDIAVNNRQVVYLAIYCAEESNDASVVHAIHARNYMAATVEVALEAFTGIMPC